jgi:SAM-dependent methyltransferase
VTASREPLYDRIGRGYATTRRTDPRLAAAIQDALGDARSVVNVGAGTGAYEPPGGRVVAVEPSREMIRQRPPGAAPAVRAVAEALPFADGAFDAALAVLTLHHWTDQACGLAELRRVARRRVVVLTWDPAAADRFWLTTDYLPEFVAIDLPRFPPLAELARVLGATDVRPVPIPADCIDGFLGAFWRRPEAYLDPAVRSGISSFSQVDPAAVARGVARLAADLASGAWETRHGPLRRQDALDLGYRLLVAARR